MVLNPGGRTLDPGFQRSATGSKTTSFSSTEAYAKED